MFAVKHRPTRQYVGWCHTGYFLCETLNHAKLFPRPPSPRSDVGILHLPSWAMGVRPVLQKPHKEDFEVIELEVQERASRPLFHQN